MSVSSSLIEFQLLDYRANVIPGAFSSDFTTLDMTKLDKTSLMAITAYQEHVKALADLSTPINNTVYLNSLKINTGLRGIQHAVASAGELDDYPA